MAFVLHGTVVSPFVRKVRVFCLEKGIAFETSELSPAEHGAQLRAMSPLAKIPILELDGCFLPDSSVICLYLDDIARKPTLYPDKERWSWQTRASLAHGLTEASVALRLQQVLPENERSKTQVDRFSARIERAIDGLEADAARLAAGPLRIDQIAAACALGHVDFRHTRDWRVRCPRLAAWFESFSRRPSLLATVPR